MLTGVIPGNGLFIIAGCTFLFLFCASKKEKEKRIRITECLDKPNWVSNTLLSLPLWDSSVAANDAIHCTYNGRSLRMTRCCGVLVSHYKPRCVRPVTPSGNWCTSLLYTTADRSSSRQWAVHKWIWKFENVVIWKWSDFEMLIIELVGIFVVSWT